MATHEGIEHVGFITTSRAKFESFWCEVLGYRKVKESHLPPGLVTSLFNIERPVATVRYEHPDGSGPDIEIHIVGGARPTELPEPGDFFSAPINHVCLKVADKVAFLKSLPIDVRQHLWQGGEWLYSFVRDYEGNWIEIRQ